MAAILVKLNNWTVSIQARVSETILRRQLTAPATTSDAIQEIAKDFIDQGTRLERRLLSKSLQEALYYCVGFDPNLTLTQIKRRLKRFLDRHKKSAFVQQFLSLYFFNHVWFHTRELFRRQAMTSEVFERDMEEVEKACRRAVTSALKPYKQLERLSDQRAAEELIRNIEQRLRGI